VENENDDDDLCTAKGQSEEDRGGIEEGGEGGEEMQGGGGQAQGGGRSGGSRKETGESPWRSEGLLADQAGRTGH